MPPIPTKFIVDERKRFESLSAAHPVLMLPTRLETRFDLAAKQLRIRIYPDAIHHDGHPPLLDARERADAEAYWQLRAAALDATSKLAADRWLCERIPERRAAYVARVTKPTRDARGKLVFPTLALRSESPPAQARALPSHFAAIGWLDGARRFVAFGKPVRPTMPLAPTLGQPAWSKTAGALPIDAESAWLVDYGQALAVGMAIGVDLVAELADLLTRGLDALLVVGVRAETPAQGAATLGSLLDAHLYDQGLEFVAQGTPTNNTEEGSAGWTEAIDDLGDHFARELGDRAPASDPERDSTRLTSALGLPAGSLARVLGGERSEARSARAMQVLLWELTFGAYFNELLAIEGQSSRVDLTLRSRARQWFFDHVRGGAPLPTLAIGSQPYGILPARSRPTLVPAAAEASSEAGFVQSLERLLTSLLARWRESLAAVPRVDGVDPSEIGASDPEQDLVAVLGSLPHPRRFVLRRLTVQRSLLMLLWGFMLESMKFNFPETGKRYAAELAKLTSIDAQIALLKSLRTSTEKSKTPELSLAPMIDALVRMLETHRERLEPLVDLSPGLLREVFDVGVADVRIATAGYGNATADRLFTRPLVQLPDAAAGARASDYLAHLRSTIPTIGGLPGAKSPGPLPSKAEPPTIAPTPQLTGNQPLLYQLASQAVAGLELTKRDDLRVALNTLAGTSVDELELRLCETLGLASHRIDAWWTSLAQRDLASLRASAPTGIQLGAWGYVESLRPAKAGARASEGFIHAPSLAHAATAAVLRAGWQSHERELAVDLRSARVRRARALAEGLRAGQPLGDMLGATFERRLHDARLDVWIDACRRAVLGGAQPTGPVDGLALLDAYEGAGLVLAAGTLRDGVAPPASLVGVAAALESLQASLDALADASLADAVHLLLQGNDARAAATLDAIATGEAPAPELRSFDSPSTALTITHRVAIVLGAAAPTGPIAPWAAGPLASLEPRLEAWLASSLPSPAAIEVRFVQGEGSEVARIGLDAIVTELGLSLQTWLAFAPSGPIDGGSAWARLAIAHLRSQARYAAATDLRIDPDHAARPDAITLADLALLAHSLHALVLAARPLDARDLAPPGTLALPGWDIAEASTRVAALRSSLDRATKPIAANAPLANFRRALLELADFGLPDAIPRRGFVEAERAELLAQHATLITKVRARLDAEQALAGAPLPDDDEGKLARLRQRLALLGDRPIVLLPKLAPPDPALAAALARSNALLEGDSSRAIGWLHDAAKVRPELARLSDALSLAALTRDAAPPTPLVAQLPDLPGDRWLALAAPSSRTQDRLCLWLLGADQQAKASLVGLVVDEFAEAIPSDEQTTGVALHFDAPSSRPPQCLVLAVPRVVEGKGEPWTFERLCDVLLDTIELAKLRAVDPDVLQGHGHHAPIIFPGLLDAGAQP